MNYVNHNHVNIYKWYSATHFCLIFSYFFFSRVYLKISKTLSAKYYQENKVRLQKKLVKEIKIFLKKETGNTVVNVTKISQKMKSLLSIEKHIIEWGKAPYYKKKFLKRFFGSYEFTSKSLFKKIFKLCFNR